MRLSSSDGRFITDIGELTTAKEVKTAPVEFSATVSSEGATLLRQYAAAFYRAEDEGARFTLTIDTVTGQRIAGTIRRS
jgi:hypothetical protein